MLFEALSNKMYNIPNYDVTNIMCYYFMYKIIVLS